MKEFIENIHLTKEDILTKSDRYLEYSINKYQSSAFPLSIINGLAILFLFRRSFQHTNPYVKNFFQINLFLSTQIFTYEIISKFYTNKNKLADIDYYLYAKDKINI